MDDPRAWGTLVATRYRLRDPLADLAVDGWHAADTRLDDRRVALCWLRDDDPRALVACTRVSHPNVALVLDRGAHAGRPFAVTERLEGAALTALVTRARAAGRRLDLAAIAALFDAMCGAVAAGHTLAAGQPVVHGALCPAAVVVREDARADEPAVKLVPGGLVRAHAQPAWYRAPELRADRGATASPAADVFALGVMLAELLTGVPHDVTGEPFALARAAAGPERALAALPSLLRGDDAVPPAVWSVLATALQADPRARFVTAQALRVALRGALAAPPPAAPSRTSRSAAEPPRAPSVRRERPARMSPSLGGSLFGLGAFAAGVALFGLWTGNRPDGRASADPPVAAADREPELAHPEPDTAPRDPPPTTPPTTATPSEAPRPEAIPSAPAAATATAPMPPAPHYAIEPAPNAPRIGPPDAPVVIDVFSDLQCPFCARLLPTLDRITQQYGARVQVRWRDRPLETLHPDALAAAEAAREARVQRGDAGYFAMVRTLLAHQHALARADLSRYAGELGLDVARFDQALARGVHRAAVRADARALTRVLPMAGTPSVFVNGAHYFGAYPFEVYAHAIDAALAAHDARTRAREAARARAERARAERPRT